MKFTEIFDGCAKWVLENAPNATANQYLLDTGDDARRGFTYGGIHLWEHVKSTGMEHFIKGQGVINSPGKSDKLYAGGDYLPFDETKSATLSREKLISHWQLASTLITPRLKEVDWRLDIYAIRDLSGNSVLFRPRVDTTDMAMLLGEHIPEGDGYITVFHFGACMPVLVPVLQKARALNVVWISDKQSVLAFDTGKIGGVISCWYPGGNAKNPQEEDIKIHLGGEVWTYHRINNQIISKKGKKMDFKNLPNVKELTEAKKAKETTVPKVKPEEVEKPEVVMHKGRLERVDGEPIIDTAAEVESTEETVEADNGMGPTEEPTVEQLFEDLLKKAEDAKLLSTAVFRDLKSLTKEVKRLQKGAGNSDEVKALKAENKELQKQLKDSEKRCAQLQNALKAQAELLQKSL